MFQKLFLVILLITNLSVLPAKASQVDDMTIFLEPLVGTYTGSGTVTPSDGGLPTKYSAKAEIAKQSDSEAGIFSWALSSVLEAADGKIVNHKTDFIVFERIILSARYDYFRNIDGFWAGLKRPIRIEISKDQLSYLVCERGFCDESKISVNVKGLTIERSLLRNGKVYLQDKIRLNRGL